MSIQTVRNFKMVSPMSEIMQATKCLICDYVFRLYTVNISENPVATSSISLHHSKLTNKAFSPSAIARAVWKLFYEAFGIKLDPSYFSSSVERKEFFDTNAPPVCIACCNHIRQRRSLQRSKLNTITDNIPLTLISTAHPLQEEYESIRSAIIMGLCQVELNEGGGHKDHENGKSVTATTSTKVTNKSKNKVTNNNRNRSNILPDAKSPNALETEIDTDTETEIKPHTTEVFTNASKTDPGEARMLKKRETVALALVNTLTSLTETEIEPHVANLTEMKELLQLPSQSMSANRPVLSPLSLETTEHRFNKDVGLGQDMLENHEPNDDVSFSKIIQHKVTAVSGGSSGRAKSRTKKPQECKLCKKTVCSTESLKVHMRTHTGEKPFVCCVCSRKFSDRSNLLIHKKLHTQILEHPFSCETCGKRYVNGARLRVHLRTHTGEVPYPCDECSQSFATSSLRTRHKKKMHLRIKTIMS